MNKKLNILYQCSLFDLYNVFNLQVMLKPPMFIYGRANCERIYVLGWSEMNSTILSFGELRRLNQFGHKRAHNALLFNKPI